MQRYFTINVTKTKALIISVVSAQLICTFVFVYTKRKLSHGAAYLNVIIKHAKNIILD